MMPTPTPNGDVFGGCGDGPATIGLRPDGSFRSQEFIYRRPPPLAGYPGPAEDAAVPLIVRVERLEARVAEMAAILADVFGPVEPPAAGGEG